MWWGRKEPDLTPWWSHWSDTTLPFPQCSLPFDSRALCQMTLGKVPNPKCASEGEFSSREDIQSRLTSKQTPCKEPECQALLVSEASPDRTLWEPIDSRFLAPLRSQDPLERGGGRETRERQTVQRNSSTEVSWTLLLLLSHFSHVVQSPLAPVFTVPCVTRTTHFHNCYQNVIP